MKKRLTSLVLAVVMIVAFTVPASAADGSIINLQQKRNTYTEGKFTDVPADAWYGTALKTCYESGIFLGTTDTTFSPSGSLTVAQAITLADRLNSIYYGGDGKLPAAASGQEWYEPAVAYAKANGILNSMEYVHFSQYNVPATRAQMAYLIANALPSSAYEMKNTVTTLPDVRISDAFGAQIFLLYRAGVLIGNDSYGTFRPDSNISRAATAAILARVIAPAQRQTLAQYQVWTAGETAFGMPGGSTRTTYTSTTVEVDSADKTQKAMVVMDRDSAYEEVSITQVPQDTLKSAMTATLGNAGLTAQNLTLTAVKFGDVAAYRSIFTASNSSKTIPCCSYIYINGDTLYMYVAASESQENLTTMVNSVTVAGKSVTPTM